MRPNRGGRQNFFAQNKSPPRPPLRIGTLSKNSGLVSSETLLRSSIWAISAMSATASTRREGARYGEQPARVPDGVIAEIRSRERGGLIELPKLRLEPGMRVKVLQGPLQDHIGLLAALRPHERVLVLLQLLGGQQRVELARGAIEAVE